MFPFVIITMLLGIILGLIAVTAMYFLKATGWRVAVVFGGFMMAIVTAILVESFGVSVTLYYSFGDFLFQHVIAATLTYGGTVVFGFIVVLLAWLGSVTDSVPDNFVPTY
jgi:hypothetical protein